MEKQKVDTFADQTTALAEARQDLENMTATHAFQAASYCPNCGAQLEGRKCKLFCLTPGCGYLVTCSEW